MPTGVFLGIALKKNVDTGMFCQMPPQASRDRPQPLHVDVREDEKTVLGVGFNSFENQRNLLRHSRGPTLRHVARCPACLVDPAGDHFKVVLHRPEKPLLKKRVVGLTVDRVELPLPQRLDRQKTETKLVPCYWVDIAVVVALRMGKQVGHPWPLRMDVPCHDVG